MNEIENRRKRYCLICHLFKPERCHHCSTCGSCMLGMDHHCPWLATCIGYYNRKYFILTIIYSMTTLVITIGFNVPVLVKIFKLFFENFVFLLGFLSVRSKTKLCTCFMLCVGMFCAFFNDCQFLNFPFQSRFEK